MEVGMTPKIYSQWHNAYVAWLGDEPRHVLGYPNYLALQCKDAIVVLRYFDGYPRIEGDNNSVTIYDASLYLRINGDWRYVRPLHGEYPSWRMFFNYCWAQGQPYGCDITRIPHEDELAAPQRYKNEYDD